MAASAESSAEDVSVGTPPGHSDLPAPPPPSSARATVAIRTQPMSAGTRIDQTDALRVSSLYGVETPNGTVTIEDVGFLVDHEVVDVLTVDGGVARKLVVTYQEKGESRINNGKERHKTSPVSGKSYVVEWVDGQPQVTDPNGGGVPESERRVVAVGFRSFGEGDAFARALHDGPLSIGVPVPALADALKENIRRGAERRVFFGKVIVSPKENRHINGVLAVVFDVVVQVGFETEDAKTRMNLKGELLLRGDNAWPLALDVSGPVAADLVVKGMTAHGSGTARITSGYAYP